VLFSHGFGGYRVQSAFLTTHLASWGFVVAAPEHPSRDLAAVLGGRLNFGSSADLGDLRAALTMLAAQQKAGPLAGRIDLAHVAVTGHSAGANAAVKLAAADPRVAGVVALAGGGISLLGGAKDPKKPVLFIGGTGDQVARPSSMRDAYAGASPPKRLVMITGAGHLAFADVCVVDRSTGGLRAVAKTYGITVPLVMDRLGTDGCAPPDIPVEQAWPIIRQFTVAELRAVFTGTAATAGAGLDQATADALGSAKATVQSTLR
jgi:predicted dienelactone hydrolase